MTFKTLYRYRLRMPLKKANQTSFKPGNQASKGRRRKKKKTYNPEELISRKIDNRLITSYITLNSHLTPMELVERMQSERVSTLESMIIKALLKGYRTGDVNQLSFFLDRLVGKVPNKLDVRPVKNPYEDMSVEELIELKNSLTDTMEVKKLNYEKSDLYEEQLNQLEAAIEEHGATGHSLTPTSD